MFVPFVHELFDYSRRGLLTRFRDAAVDKNVFDPAFEAVDEIVCTEVLLVTYRGVRRGARTIGPIGLPTHHPDHALSVL